MPPGNGASNVSKGQINLIDDQRHPGRTIVLLAWPIFMEQLLVAMVRAVDTAMVGSLGAAATASVAINSSPNMVMEGIWQGLGAGFTALVAQSVGAGDLERARHLLRQALLLVAVVSIPCSVLIFALGRQIPLWMGGQPEILNDAELYCKILALSLTARAATMTLTAIFRGYGDTKTPMTINVMVNALNVVGNYLMIYPTRTITVLGKSFTMVGCGWGVAGAAVSTSLSSILGGVILLSLCFIKNTGIRISLRDSFAPHRDVLADIFHVGMPTMLERFTMTSAFVVLGHTVAILGTAQLAAHNLAGTAESISFMPGFAFGTAVTTLFGQCIGARRPDLAHRYVVHTIRIGTVVMAFMTVLLFVRSNAIIGLFTPDPEVIRMGGVLLKILAVIQIPQMITMVYSGALKGAGDARSSLIICIASIWTVRISGILVCVHLLHMGLTSICVCMCCDNVTRCILFFLRYRQGHWSKALPEAARAGA